MGVKKPTDTVHPDTLKLRQAENKTKKKEVLRRGKIVRDLKQGK